MMTRIGGERNGRFGADAPDEQTIVLPGYSAHYEKSKFAPDLRIA
jgi:hypothetical protein